MFLPLAYIDPGSGSFLLQMALAGLLGTLATLKIFWSGIAHRVRLLWGRTPQQDQQATTKKGSA